MRRPFDRANFAYREDRNNDGVAPAVSRVLGRLGRDSDRHDWAVAQSNLARVLVTTWTTLEELLAA